MLVFLFLLLLFLFERQKAADKQIFDSLVHFPNFHKQPGLGEPKASSPELHMGHRNPNI